VAKQRNLVDRLAGAGEEAIQRLGSAPGGDRVMAAVNSLRDRVDEIQKRLRGLDALETRMTAFERRLDKLEGKGSSSAASSSSRSRSSSGSSSSKKSSPGSA
jgi:phage shock protein A